MVKDPELKPIHPGEILKSEFLEPLNMSEVELAKNLQVKKSVIKDLVAEKRSVTVDLAYRLYFYFGVNAEYWLNFQKNYDLETYQELAEKEIRKQIYPYHREEKYLQKPNYYLILSHKRSIKNHLINSIDIIKGTDTQRTFLQHCQNTVSLVHFQLYLLSE